MIEAFGQQGGPATLSRLAEITGHTRASVRRSLHTLCQLGYARQDGRQFHLAARTLRLGQAYALSDSLARLAQPVLESTAERTRESASLAVLDAQDVVFIARATLRRSLSAGLGVGARLPAYASATGRVLLAAQPEPWVRFVLGRMSRPALTERTITAVDSILREIELVRRQGHALSDQELEIGLRSVAVPVRDGRGHTVGAMSLSVSTARLDVKGIVDTLLPVLERSSARLSTLM